MKKLVALLLTLVLLVTSCLILTACPDNNDGKFTVGVCQLTQHEALDAATQGFVDSLKAELGEENVEIIVQNASGDTNTVNTIIENFVNQNVDLILANATPALQAAYNKTSTIPILGTSITEYGVALGKPLDENGVFGENVSGTSDLAPLDQQAQMILDICPDVETVGIVFCTAEANSAYQVSEVKKFLEAKGVTVKEFPFSDSNDISAVVTAAADACDVLYVPTDNTAASCAETIGNVVRQKQIPLFAGEEGICRGCGVATLSISYYDLGVTTGKMAAKILKGEAKVSEMPIEYAPVTKKFNKEMAELLGITIPEDFVEIK